MRFRSDNKQLLDAVSVASAFVYGQQRCRLASSGNREIRPVTERKQARQVVELAFGERAFEPPIATNERLDLFPRESTRHRFGPSAVGDLLELGAKQRLNTGVETDIDIQTAQQPSDLNGATPESENRQAEAPIYRLSARSPARCAPIRAALRRWRRQASVERSDRRRAAPPGRRP
jgi:hypothetical protein